MRADPLRAALSSRPSDLRELGVHSADAAMRLAFDVKEGVDTAKGITTYIDKLQGALPSSFSYCHL
jgi:hypothetical protein